MTFPFPVIEGVSIMGYFKIFMTRPERMIRADTVVCFSKYGLYDFTCVCYEPLRVSYSKILASYVPV